MGRRGALPQCTVRRVAPLPGTARDLHDADAAPAFRGTGAVESDAADRLARLTRRAIGRALVGLAERSVPVDIHGTAMYNAARYGDQQRPHGGLLDPDRVGHPGRRGQL